jgi:hypothetical protein
VLETGFDGTPAANASRIFTDADPITITIANTRNSPIRFAFGIRAS